MSQRQNIFARATKRIQAQQRRHADVYGKTVALLYTIHNVECWNWTCNNLVHLPLGTEIKIHHAYDETHTTVSVTGPDGMEFTLADGTKKRGYRFIIPNAALAKSTGLPVPAKTVDIIGDIIREES